jgi:hypothetical protein
MSRIFYDCEFLEDGRTIDLISIGLAADDGREYYAVASDAPWDRIRKHDWLVRNVVPYLPVTGRTSLDSYLANHPNSYPRPLIDFVGPDLADSHVKPRQVIANEVRDFILAAPDPQMWAWYGASDFVALYQLWGPLIHLPKGVPMWTNDLKQEAERLGNPDFPSLPGVTRHNALDDAREVKYRYDWLMAQGKPAETGLDKVAAAVRKARGGDPPVQVRGFA